MLLAWAVEAREGAMMVSSKARGICRAGNRIHESMIQYFGLCNNGIQIECRRVVVVMIVQHPRPLQHDPRLAFPMLQCFRHDSS